MLSLMAPWSHLSGWEGASLGPGDLNVTSCSTPKVRSLDGVARALLCVELKPCRLHEVEELRSSLLNRHLHQRHKNSFADQKAAAAIKEFSAIERASD
jgi:hypothetical protein